MLTGTHRTADSLRDEWAALGPSERVRALEALPRPEADEIFRDLSAAEQAGIILALPASERRSWLRLLPPDDVVDCLQATPDEARDELLQPLDDVTRREVTALLAYADDDAGGLMSPRFARLRPEMQVDEALTYLRRQALERVETLYYAYVLDPEQRLLGVVSVRELFTAPPDKTVVDVMRRDVVAVRAETDQEDVGRLLAERDLLAVPVVDADNRMMAS